MICFGMSKGSATTYPVRRDGRRGDPRGTWLGVGMDLNMNITTHNLLLLSLLKYDWNEMFIAVARSLDVMPTSKDWVQLL